MPRREPMKELNGRERMICAYEKQYPDRVPTDIMGTVNLAPRLLGISREEIAKDPQKAAEARIKIWELAKTDTLTVGILSLPMSQAVGNQCEFNSEGVLHVRKHILEEKGNLGKMTIPDSHKDAPLPFTLEVCERVGSALKEEIAVRGIIPLPWTLAIQMRGMEKLIYDTVDDPDFVHEVMKFGTEYVKMFGCRILESIGEGVFGLYAADPAAGCSVISPQIYRDFVKPYQEEIIDFFKTKNTTVTFHICGFIDPIIEDIVATDLDGMSIDEATSLKKMIETSNGKTVVIGNLSPQLFQNGSKADIEEAVRKCMETANGQCGYILATGCAVPPHTPIENLHHFLEAAGKYGRYDQS
jgi:MtaA/CmuA family methyltransferase